MGGAWNFEGREWKLFQLTKGNETEPYTTWIGVLHTKLNHEREETCLDLSVPKKTKQLTLFSLFKRMKLSIQLQDTISKSLEFSG